jgi:ubiquinone/menaquinone biosynthesis C-methylase UbiE
MSLSSEQLVEVLRAAGEPSRLRILALLAREELAVMELSQILDQSQPRVSRHLKLLSEAGLAERFPDGAWVFYRLTADVPRRAVLDQALGRIAPTDPLLSRDAERLEQVRRERSDAAGAYFARNAARWDELRTLYVEEADVEAAVLEAVGPGPFKRLVDLGSGTGRMLTLLADRVDSAIGLDLSQQMLNIARRNAADAGLDRLELRHGDIFETRLAAGCADLVVVHQVLHYLSDPAAALAEAARLVAPGGKLLIVDFAPHGLEFLREAHQHRRLGFSDAEMGRWFEAAGLSAQPPRALPPAKDKGLTVKIWTAERASLANRSAA